MIRQLGLATLFCSFSAAETKWNHLLRILGKLIDKNNYNKSCLLAWRANMDIQYVLHVYACAMYIGHVLNEQGTGYERIFSWYERASKN